MRDLMLQFSNNIFIEILMLAICADTLLGVLRAIKFRQFNSSVGIDGAIRKLAEKMIDAIVKVMKPSTGITYNRGVVTKTKSNGADWYGVIRGAVSGAASQGQAKNGPVRYDYIVEHGFHDNPKECLFLSKQENLKAIAEAKAAAIAEYFGIGNKNQSANQSGHGSQNSLNNNSHQTNQNTSKDGTILNKKTAHLVRVAVDNLNIRQAPTIYSKAVGFTGKGGIYHYRRSNGNCQCSRREKPMGKTEIRAGVDMP